MESVETIRKVVEETLERKLTEALPVKLKFPLPLSDHFVLKGKKIKILLEIYEDRPSCPLWLGLFSQKATEATKAKTGARIGSALRSLL